MPLPAKKAENDTALLRARAEEKLRGHAEEVSAMSPGDIRATLHELHVHQIELEMQNEELRGIQADLERATDRYIGLYDFAPVGYVSINEKGIITAANLTSTQLLGIERSLLVRQPFSRFVIKEDQDTFYLCLRKAFTSALKESCEVRMRSAEGAAFDCRLEAVRAYDEDVTVCHLTLSDVTEQKYAAEILRENERRQLQYENEERMRLALEAGDLGTWDQDFLTGQIVCSDRTLAILGLPPGSLMVWQTLIDLVHPEDRQAFLRAAEASTLPGGPCSFDQTFRIQPGKGGLRWVKFAAKCFFNGAPPVKPIRRTGVFADFTRQKQAEDLLQSRARQLESLVQERTAGLREAVSELEHFSYTLVHDLRAPLRAIRGYCDLLLGQSANVSPAHRQFLERAASASERMDCLIRDALNYNKIVRQDFNLEPVDGAALLRELIDSYPDFHAARNLIILEGDFPLVLGNSALLTQCFSNLLANALKFVAPGQTPAVRIKAHDCGDRVRMVFEDNGIGIAEESRDKVFGMFQRLNEEYEGTGIGLALVKKAAERMRGTVGVEPLHHGSRFWIELNKANLTATPSATP